MSRFRTKMSRFRTKLLLLKYRFRTKNSFVFAKSFVNKSTFSHQILYCFRTQKKSIAFAQLSLSILGARTLIYWQNFCAKTKQNLVRKWDFSSKILVQKRYYFWLRGHYFFSTIDLVRNRDLATCCTFFFVRFFFF